MSIIENHLQSTLKARWETSEGVMVVYSWDDASQAPVGHRDITKYLENLYGCRNVELVYAAVGSSDYILMYRLKSNSR